MNNALIDKELINEFSKSKPNVPFKLSCEINRSLDSLPDRKIKKVPSGTLTAASIGLVFCILITAYILRTADSSDKIVPSLESKATKIRWISGLSQLKAESDIIVEVEVTDKVRAREYKRIPTTITTVKVNRVFKGDINASEIDIMQDISVKLISNKQKLLMFLRRGVDNPDCYVSVGGGGQGIYKISSTALNNQTNFKSEFVEAYDLSNGDIMRDLSGDYEEVKKKLID